MHVIWIVAIILSVSLNGCILKNKSFTITDKKTGTSITVDEDDLSIGIGSSFENNDLKIDVKELKEE